MHTAKAEMRSAGFWASLREALAGTYPDFTVGNLDRAIVMLAIPMVLEMAMESLFGVVDVFWVARLGENAISTVGLTESLMTIVFSIAMGAGMAATAMVSRRIGEKEEGEAQVVAVQTIALGLFLSVITAILGYRMAPALLHGMGATDAVVHFGSGYTRMYFAGITSLYLLFMVNAVLRGAGDAATAMQALWIANAVNILLNPCLIFGLGPFPHLGVVGSAVGTTVGRSIGVLYGIWMLTRGTGKLKVPIRAIRLNVGVMLRLVRLSLGGIFQYLVQMVSWLALVRLIASFGSAAVAANTLAIRVIVFAILPSWGLSNAAATLVGQNLGAGKPDRAETAVWRTGLYNMIFLGSIGVLFLLFADRIVHLFTVDPVVGPLAIKALRFFSCGNISYGYGMVTVQALNGAGDTRTPTLLNGIAFWLIQIPLAYLLAYHTSLGLSGAWVAVVIGDSALAAMGVLWFRTGRWRGIQV
jgi:putative MATE family efflux protein